MQKLAFLSIYISTQVVGGVAADEFLASVEQLDSSNKQDVLYQVHIHSWNSFFFIKFDDFAQREWRMVAQALSVPRYDFAMAHIPTSRWVTWPDLTRAKSFENPSGWTQARYARSHRVQVWEVGDHLHCTNSAIDWVHFVLALRKISVHPKTLLDGHLNDLEISC